MKLILFGYMGSGKTTIGKELSSALEYSFLDLDLEIEKKEQSSITDIFSSHGEVYFRRKENAVLKETLNLNANLVLATGGGTPCYGDSLEHIKSLDDVKSIYLKASLEEITSRLFLDKESRPLISHLKSEFELKDFIRKHMFERSYYYSQADMIIEVNGLSKTDLIEKIIVGLF